MLIKNCLKCIKSKKVANIFYVKKCLYKIFFIIFNLIKILPLIYNKISQYIEYNFYCSYFISVCYLNNGAKSKCIPCNMERC